MFVSFVCFVLALLAIPIACITRDDSAILGCIGWFVFWSLCCAASSSSAKRQATLERIEQELKKRR